MKAKRNVKKFKGGRTLDDYKHMIENYREDIFKRKKEEKKKE